MAWRLFSTALLLLLVMLLKQHQVAAHMGLDKAPSVDPRCHAQSPFCARGRRGGGLPTVQPEDGLVVFLLRSEGLGRHHEPFLSELQSHFPGLQGLWSSYRESLGFYSFLMKRNFTLSWDPLFGTSSGATPLLLDKGGDPIWCNVGASCFTSVEGGSMEAASVVKVAEMTGENFNQMAAWVQSQNATATPFDLWTVYNGTGSNMTVQFDARDSNGYVQGVIAKLSSIGANFIGSVTARRSRLALYSDAAKPLGNGSDIFGPKSKQQALAKDMLKFFSYFRPGQTLMERARSTIGILVEVMYYKRFFIYRDDTYWQLQMIYPYFAVTDEFWPLPKAAYDFPFLL
ncbi:bis(monoacylglycero)phosphate synthase CLN5-like isoform X2 [Petromyzon marinus]|uniref:bis(monoacylglycero)phosphate synthase CLN5-like isoform X2 n=1 Tax=Petromyzon marinus TaxID=7757 RepID=UPI003F716D80